MNINIDETLIDFITEQAKNDDVTAEVWCERKLNANIKQIRREKLFDTIKSDIEAYEPVVLAKKEELQAIEDAKVIEETATTNEEVINP